MAWEARKACEAASVAASAAMRTVGDAAKACAEQEEALAAWIAAEQQEAAERVAARAEKLRPFLPAEPSS